jgi:hypothetical protein
MSILAVNLPRQDYTDTERRVRQVGDDYELTEADILLQDGMGSGTITAVGS